MKTICAWCGAQIKTTCDCCGDPLQESVIPGEMNCHHGPTPIRYSAFAISRMSVSHGMCRDCQNLSNEQRDELVRENDERTAAILQKRGPTGVSQSATTRGQRTPKKGGARS